MLSEGLSVKELLLSWTHVRYIGSKTVTGHLQFGQQQHWPVIDSCHYPGQLLMISADQWKNWGK